MKPLIKVLRVVVSLGLLLWLVSKVDFSSLGADLAGADLKWFFIPNLLTPLTLGCGIWRWQILMRARGIRVRHANASRYMIIGHFVSNFLPSNVGGDVVRASLVAREAGKDKWSTAAGAVVVDRICGLVGLLVILPIFGAFNFRWLTELKVVYPLAAACAAIAVATVFIFSDWGAGLLAWIGRFRFTQKPMRIVRDLHDSMLAYRSTPAAVVQAIGVSCLFYVVCGLQVFCLLPAFPEVDVAWTSQVVAFCAVSLLAMLPISFNGYGLQEGGYVLFFVSLGFTPTQGVTLALANRVLSLVVSAVGALLLAFSDFSAAELSQSRPTDPKLA